MTARLQASTPESPDHFLPGSRLDARLGEWTVLDLRR